MAFKMLGIAALATMVAVPAMAQMAAPSPSTFVKKAGASDLFERDEAKVMMTSSNADIAKFANKMMTDHTKSTDMVKMAAKQDGLHPAPPMLTADQSRMLAKLKAAPKGKTRQMLYVSQQKTAHADALQLMQTYSASGTATHLKAAAGQIEPVVQSHVDMLNSMAM